MQLREGGKYERADGKIVTITKFPGPYLDFQGKAYPWRDAEEFNSYMDDGTYDHTTSANNNLCLVREVSDVAPTEIPTEPINRDVFKKKFKAAYDQGKTVDQALDYAFADTPVPAQGQVWSEHLDKDRRYWLIANGANDRFQLVSLCGFGFISIPSLQAVLTELKCPQFLASSVKDYVDAGGKFEP